MGRRATVVELAPQERQTLLEWQRSGRAEQGLAFRTQVMLMAAEGMATKSIAALLKPSPHLALAHKQCSVVVRTEANLRALWAIDLDPRDGIWKDVPLCADIPFEIDVSPLIGFNNAPA